LAHKAASTDLAIIILDLGCVELTTGSISSNGGNRVLRDHNQGIISRFTSKHVSQVHGKGKRGDPAHLDDMDRNSLDGVGLGQIDNNSITSKNVTTNDLVVLILHVKCGRAGESAQRYANNLGRSCSGADIGKVSTTIGKPSCGKSFSGDHRTSTKRESGKKME